MKQFLYLAMIKSYRHYEQSIFACKLVGASFLAKKVHYLPPKQVSGTNSRNAIGRNPSIVIPLLANQDLTSISIGMLSIGSKSLIG